MFGRTRTAATSRRSPPPAAAAKQQHHLSYHELEDALEQTNGSRFQAVLLASIGLVWAGDAAEVMVLSYLGPAVSVCIDVFNPFATI
jgi:hypothetical protein